MTPPDGADDDSLQATARELAQMLERHYERWLQTTPGMESPQAQMIVFTLAAKKLAQAGVGLTPLVKQTFRTYGLNPQDIQIEDVVTGEELVSYQAAAALLLAPGSKRSDN